MLGQCIERLVHCTVLMLPRLGPRGALLRGSVVQSFCGPVNALQAEVQYRAFILAGAGFLITAVENYRILSLSLLRLLAACFACK